MIVFIKYEMCSEIFILSVVEVASLHYGAVCVLNHPAASHNL